MDIYEKLYEIKAVQFGEFTLKSKIISPIYIDLRICISYPNILKELAKIMSEKIKNIHFDTICGVPYTGIFMASALSFEKNIPMILKRKEKKDYGTKKMVEGVFSKNDRCLVVEDITTTGSSLIETIESLRSEHLLINHAIVVMDRGNNTEERLKEIGCKMIPLFHLKDLLTHLKLKNKISDKAHQKIIHFLSGQNS